LGKAGQLAVMSELLMQGWNVAIPEVDVGDDIFVVKDDDGTLRRVQVKARTGTRTKRGFSATFDIPRRQIQPDMDMYFVLLARVEGKWSDLVIISSAELRDHLDLRTKENKSKNVGITLAFVGKQVLCSKADFSRFRNDFTYFPRIEH